jgi:hypothetical protein
MQKKTEDLLVFVSKPEDIFKSPDIEDLKEPKNCVEIDTLFCDSSGFGSPNERALTAKQAIDKVKQLLNKHGTLYSGLTGIGQFQVYVTLYKKI